MSEEELFEKLEDIPDIETILEMEPEEVTRVALKLSSSLWDTEMGPNLAVPYWPVFPDTIELLRDNPDALRGILLLFANTRDWVLSKPDKSGVLWW